MRARVRRRRIPRQPYTAYTYLCIDGAGRTTAAEVVRALTDDAAATLVVERINALLPDGSLANGVYRLELGERVLASVTYTIERADGWFSISRRDATDEEWHRCQAAPRTLRSTEVCSGWEFAGTAAEWLALVEPP